MGYEVHNEITKELLGSIQPGDRIKVNDWKMPLKVMAISENFFVMARKMFDDYEYSVVSKSPAWWHHNEIMPGFFYCGPDDRIFGWCDHHEDNNDVSIDQAFKYRFDDAGWVFRYLQAFEKKEISISERRGCSIRTMRIQRKIPA